MVDLSKMDRVDRILFVHSLAERTALVQKIDDFHRRGYRFDPAVVKRIKASVLI